MEAAKILTADFLDIVFEGRNKAYGAYSLRKTYESRVWMSLAITAGIVLLAAGAAYLSSSFREQRTLRVFKTTELNIAKIEAENKPLPVRQEPPKAVEQPKIKTVALVNPKVVKDVEVSVPPPTQDDMETAKISNVTQDGAKDLGVVIPPQGLDDGKGIVAQKPADPIDDNGIFYKVEIDAEYPGGAGAWKNFLERNLRSEVPADNGALQGNYSVLIQFVVDKNGMVSDIKPLSSVGWGMEQEAMRVIRKSGKWKPAVQNGRQVSAYRKQPVTFQVLER